MLISDKQLRANRANAKKSTGPRTEAGKKRASLNAYKHGCSAQTIIMPGESLQDFASFVKSFEDTLHPANAVELSLVQSLAQIRWSLDRMRANEIGIFALGHEQLAGTIPTDDTEVQTALASAKVMKSESDFLKTSSLYLQRNTKMFESTLKQLKELQAERKAEEKAVIQQAGNLADIHKKRKIPFESSEYGLVCNSEQLEYYLRRIDAHKNPWVPPTPLTRTA